MQQNLSSLVAGLLALAVTAPASATSVVASIKPVELLVKAVAGDSVEVSTLLPPGSSPHHYSMKPSQRRALEQADVVFWVGPDMETFLERLLDGKEFSGRAVAFLDREVRANGADEHEADGHDHHHNHGDGEDPHIWIDPIRALEMAGDIRNALADMGGVDMELLDANLARFEADLRETETRIRASFSGLDTISLFAYHSAFERFADHYGLKLEGVLTLNPELSPGARHIAEVQSKLATAEQACLLTEPQFNRQWWRSITDGLNVQFSTWDPLATDIKSTPTGYLAFQQSIADSVLECLPEQAE
ncbi:zinc ABC transporter substrate-binding protein [Marinobacter sp. VGCF2001]|uniref:zinc ABC transporter substrate-binding protein n=1 Tax=Marinobacter sp. VGCF2001 TaxID=3417189 RepID=UPI003CF1C8D0